MLYSGEQFDNELQMQYLRARFYDQNTGRFNALDPFAGNNEDPQSLHKYAYCGGDPVNGVDPSGKFTLVEFLFVTAIFFTVALSTMKYLQYRSSQRTGIIISSNINQAQWRADVQTAITYLRTSPQIAQIIDALNHSGHHINIIEDTRWPQTRARVNPGEQSVFDNTYTYINNRSFRHHDGTQYSFSKALFWELMNAYGRSVIGEPEAERDYTIPNYPGMSRTLDATTEPFPFNPANVMDEPQN